MLPTTPPDALGVAHRALPDGGALTTGLRLLLARAEPANRQLTIVDRRPMAWFTTFPCEVVTCRLGDASERRLFCKYSARRHSSSYRHRGGVAYEAFVYREVLERLELSTCRCYGAHTDPGTGDTWLVLEYLEGVVRADYVIDGSALIAASGWLAQFHAANEGRRQRGSLPGLIRYDPHYYLGWPRRTSLFAQRVQLGLPWLIALCERAEDFLGALFDAPPTVIHSEYYGQNILYDRRRGTVVPVDWESAAIGPGEIDLASLTERWPQEIVDGCMQEYLQFRRPEDSMAAFESRLAAAKMYLHFRWLGDNPTSTADPKLSWRFEELRRTGDQLGLL